MLYWLGAQPSAPVASCIAAGRVCLRICITVVGDLSNAALTAWFAGTREGLSASRHTEGGLDTLKAVAAQLMVIFE